METMGYVNPKVVLVGINYGGEELCEGFGRYQFGKAGRGISVECFSDAGLQEVSHHVLLIRDWELMGLQMGEKELE